MSDLEWIKSDKDLKEKYDKFKSENKSFAQKYESYDKFSEELVGKKEETTTDNKEESEKK